MSAATPLFSVGEPLFWPDIDVYFKGDVARAVSLVDALVDAGVGWVKGAVLQRPDLCLDVPTEQAYYVPGRGMVSERYRDILQRHVCPLPDLERIYRHALDRGQRVVLSVYDEEGLRFAEGIGASALKMPSTGLVHAPLIRLAAATGLPLALDTGKATMAEIARAVGWAREAGAVELLVQHSPEPPPAPLALHQLRYMVTLQQAFGCAVGLSDHHDGDQMLYAAVALGARVVEKGVRPDDAFGDIDLAHALPISDVARVAEGCRQVWEALGSGWRELPADRQPPAARMGLVARTDLLPGAVLDAASVDFAWPAVGVPVEEWDTVEGWQLVAPLTRGQPVEWSHVRPVDR